MFTISKEFHACCSHVLTKVPPGHPCGRLHGHNYVFEIELQAKELDPRGFVIDYRDLDDVKRWVDEVLDHHHLNDVQIARSRIEPTAENLAKAIFDLLTDEGQGFACRGYVSAVRVRETPKTCAEYRPLTIAGFMEDGVLALRREEP